MSSKQEEVIPETVDVVHMEDDDGGASDDVRLIDGEFDPEGEGKGKEALPNSSDGLSGSDNGYNSDLFLDEDEWVDNYYDDILFDDDAKFDDMDIPAGVEAPFPWLVGADGNDSTLTKTTSATSSSSSSQSSKDPFRTEYGKIAIEPASNGKRKSPLSPAVSISDHPPAPTNVSSVAGAGSYPPLSTSTKAPLPPLNMLQGASWVNSGIGSALTSWADDTSLPNKVDPSNMDQLLRNFRAFKRFDIVDEDFWNHHYAQCGRSTKQAPSNWAKVIQEEWRILEKDLPDDIFVRVYESRMDLLRAVIIGADGTPYHEGLFFFDVCFPGNYPNVPPQVHYHSGGLRINPNLYNCGKVCLSLLNTWPGRSQKEQWIPGTSTMLQVLVSIQGLILNAEPYYNEPGYANTSCLASGQKASLDYNESTFMLSLRTMVYTMRNPPKHFEDFVVGYFCKNACYILLSCKAYLEGAQVGSLVKGSGIQDFQKGNMSCSPQFQTTLAGFLNHLIKAFQRIGAQGCEKFLPMPPKENESPCDAPGCSSVTGPKPRALA